MSEASFEAALNELRVSAPPAPERLREQVRSLRTARPARSLCMRPALGVALAIAVTIAVAAGLIGSLGGPKRAENASVTALQSSGARAPRAKGVEDFSPQLPATPSLTAKSRLQRQSVSMRLRVDDLSGATQNAVRTTRRLGGFIAGADYATGSSEGNSRLALRVPVANLQKAIASFTQLGTILSQHIAVADLQAGLDRLNVRIAKARHEGKDKALQRLEHRREVLIREGTYARISLQLTTSKQAPQAAPPPGRFDRFLDNAGDILGT